MSATLMNTSAGDGAAASRLWPRVLVAVAAMLSLGALLAGCSSSSSQTNSSSQSRFVAGDGSLVLLPPDQRQPAPDITGTTFADQPFALKDYRGKVVALNVWASWCAPCRAEAPALNQVSRELQSKDVQFIGLNTRDSKASAEAFIQRFEVPYPNVWDPDAQLNWLSAIHYLLRRFRRPCSSTSRAGWQVGFWVKLIEPSCERF